MPERNHIRPSEIIVATAHDLLMAPEGGQPHTLEAPRNDANELDMQRVLRASERRIEVGTARVELEDGQERSLPVFEVAYTGLENPYQMHRLMAGLALNQVVAGSRLGGRYLYQVNQFMGVVNVWDRFGHPANIIRDPDTGGIIAAERIGVPQRTEYAGPNLAQLNRSPLFEGTSKLINYLPEDMYLQAGDETLHVANCGYVADVNYHYEPMGQTAEGAVIARSTPEDVVGMPERPASSELRLVHTEVLFESLRLGIASPEEASRMVIACGLGRMPSGQQGNTFTGLAYYDAATLRNIYEAIRL